MTAVDEVVALTSELIRIDTTNTGDPATGAGERVAAEYVAGKLTEVGYGVEVIEGGAPGRTNVVARLAGADATRAALLVHCHLDVVPAEPAEWSVHPFSGEVRDGYVWGRGAVDMKHMVAMTLAVARQYRRDATVPRRDLVFAFVADEESGGQHGAGWLVEHRRELFDGVTEAIGEVGGFSITLHNGRRAYLVQTAEKGVGALRLRARGRAGHASLPQPDNAVARLAAAVARLHAHQFPVHPADPVPALLAGLRELGGPDWSDEPERGASVLDGPLARLVAAALRDTASVTMFQAGYKDNVVPSLAEAAVDTRVLPGREAAFAAEVAAILGPEIEIEARSLPPVWTSFDGPLIDALTAAMRAEDPGAPVLPYLLPAATDAKAFARLGIRHIGFTPLRLPADLDFLSLFHGVDERVPVAALEFGTRVLERFLRTC